MAKKRNNTNIYCVKNLTTKDCYNEGDYGHNALGSTFLAGNLKKELYISGPPEINLQLAVLFKALSDYDNYIKHNKINDIFNLKEKSYLKMWFKNWEFGELSLKTILENCSDYPEQAYASLSEYVKDRSRTIFLTNLFCTRRFNKNAKK